MRIIARPAFSGRNGNPYNWLLYTHIEKLGHQVLEYSPFDILKGRYDIWHLHWPEFFLNYDNYILLWRRFTTTIALINAARIRGKKIIWTVHNLQAHERFHPLIEYWFWKSFIPLLDGYIYLSESGKETILNRFPYLRTLPGYLVPHGHYRGIYPDNITKEQSRSKLGLPMSIPVIAFIGHIRPYKNIPHLIRTFNKIENKNAIMMIAGKSDFELLNNEIYTASDSDPSVRLFLDYIPEEDMQLYMRASDLIVLPFKEIFNSGSALLALSFNKPILVPQKGSLGELQKLVGYEWVHTYSDELTPNILSESIEWALQTSRPEQPNLEKNNWEQIAIKTIEAYQDVCFG